MKYNGDTAIACSQISALALGYHAISKHNFVLSWRNNREH